MKTVRLGEFLCSCYVLILSSVILRRRNDALLDLDDPSAASELSSINVKSRTLPTNGNHARAYRRFTYKKVAKATVQVFTAIFGAPGSSVGRASDFGS